MTLEYALQHDARQRGLLALRMAHHLLDVVAGPARRGDRIAAEAERMDADRKARLLGGLIDRPVAALAQRLDIAAEQQHLNEIAVAGALADFGGGRRAVLVGDHDRSLETAVLAGPLGDLPVIDRAGQRRAQILVANALSGLQRAQHSERDVMRVEMLLLHERQRRALRSALRRTGVTARRIRLRLRVGWTLHHALVGMLAVGFEMLMPAAGQIGIEVLQALARRMNVAIGNRGVDALGRSR